MNDSKLQVAEVDEGLLRDQVAVSMSAPGRSDAGLQRRQCGSASLGVLQRVHEAAGPPGALRRSAESLAPQGAQLGLVDDWRLTSQAAIQTNQFTDRLTNLGRLIRSFSFQSWSASEVWVVNSTRFATTKQLAIFWEFFFVPFCNI